MKKRNLENEIITKYGTWIVNSAGDLEGIKGNDGKLRAITCEKVARSPKADRCDSCQHLHTILQKRRGRENASTSADSKKYTPLSSLPAAPFVQKIIQNLSSENRELKKTVETLKSEAEDEEGIEIEVRWI